MGPPSKNMLGANYPPNMQESLDFPYNLRPEAHACFEFELDADGDKLILPRVNDKGAPMYTVKWSRTKSPFSHLIAKIYRNQEGKPDAYDSEKPMSALRLHSNQQYVDFDFFRVNGGKISNACYNIMDRKDAFRWPATPDDKKKYHWWYPSSDWDLGERPWLFAHLCGMKDKKTIDKDHIVAIAIIYKSLCDGRSKFWIPMREILNAGDTREVQLQHMDDIVTVVTGFMEIKVRFFKGNGSSSTHTDTSVIASNVSASASLCM